jgi:hypothetical protein
MTEKTTIPVPIALKELINSNNTLLLQYQQELSKKVISANIEIMEILGLNPVDGWRLDMDNFVYVKQELTNNNDS